MKINATLSINSFTSGGEPDRGVRITVVDDASGSKILEVDISHEEFGLAVTGLGHRPTIRATLTPELAGKRRETKSIEVEWKGRYDDKAGQRAALEEYEVDGWRGRDEDLRNHHRRSGPGRQSVTFVRFVDVT